MKSAFPEPTMLIQFVTLLPWIHVTLANRAIWCDVTFAKCKHLETSASEIQHQRNPEKRWTGKEKKLTMVTKQVWASIPMRMTSSFWCSACSILQTPLIILIMFNPRLIDQNLCKLSSQRKENLRFCSPFGREHFRSWEDWEKGKIVLEKSETSTSYQVFPREKKDRR